MVKAKFLFLSEFDIFKALVFFFRLFRDIFNNLKYWYKKEYFMHFFLLVFYSMVCYGFFVTQKDIPTVWIFFVNQKDIPILWIFL